MNNSLSSDWENVGFPSGITKVLERRLGVGLGLGVSLDIILLSPSLAPENDNRFLLKKKKKKYYFNQKLI